MDDLGFKIVRTYGGDELIARDMGAGRATAWSVKYAETR